MANHKWKNISTLEHGPKMEECSICGINRSWYGAEYQCWFYFYPGYGYGAVDKEQSFKRPECKKVIKNKQNI